MNANMYAMTFFKFIKRFWVYVDDSYKSQDIYSDWTEPSGLSNIPYIIVETSLRMDLSRIWHQMNCMQIPTSDVD